MERTFAIISQRHKERLFSFGKVTVRSDIYTSGSIKNRSMNTHPPLEISNG